MDAERLIDDDFEPLWTTEDVAAYLKIPVSSVRAARRTMGLPAVSIGATYRFRPSSVREWVVAQENVQEVSEGFSEKIDKARAFLESWHQKVDFIP